MNKHLYVDLMHHACVTWANRPALHIKRDGQYKTWTYNDFLRDLNKLASVLEKEGIQKGAAVAIIGENSPEWVIAFHAIILTGACAVPVDPNIPGPEIDSIIAATGAKAVFCSPVFLPFFKSLRRKHPFLQKIIVLDSASADEPSFYQYIAEGNPDYDAFGGTYAPEDPMVIIFTSGTTGRPKGVVLTQKNYTTVVNHAIPRMKLGPGDTALSVLPLHHVLGFAAGVAGPLGGGMEVVFVPQLKGPLILDALREKGVTMMPLVPKMIALFYDNILLNVRKKGLATRAAFNVLMALSIVLGPLLGAKFRRKLFGTVHRNFGGKVRVIISGGAALGKKYWNGFRLLGFNILEGYGLTETFGPITVCPFDDPRLLSVGPVLPENEIKIASPGPDGIGEVHLRGSCVFKGYFNRDDLTAEVFDAGGWFQTGDLGRLDKDGFLYIAGRKKDTIVLASGKNVYPDELEDYYSLSPSIEEIGIFGLKKDGREIVAAVVVPVKQIRKSQSITQAAQTIHRELSRLAKEVPSYRAVSDQVVVYQPLPRTTTRKIKKNELPAIFAAAKSSAGSLPERKDDLSVIETSLMETGEFRRIVDSLVSVAERLKGKAVTPRTCFKTDLGLDSLDQLELIGALEETFSISISEELYDKAETIEDIIALIKEIRTDGRIAQ